MDPLDWSRTRALVTGAGSGLGRAFCEVLSGRGARVLATDRDRAAAEETVRRIAADGAAAAARVDALACDVARDADAAAAAAAARERMGGLDLLVNNAGIAIAGFLADVAEADWQRIFEVNVIGGVRLFRACLALLREARPGWVLNVASAAGFLTAPCWGPYAASKAAMVSFTETLAIEGPALGIRASCFCPMYFRTGIAHRAAYPPGTPERLRAYVEKAMDAEPRSARDMAALALDGLARGELYVVPSGRARLLWRLKRLAPGLVNRQVVSLIRHDARALGVEPFC
jgi:NAD(P)-dependent dehydrogenase (short-subunit alcohol dehydrogenase family)